ncbi:ADP/ATP translocase 3-like [Anneissia japonica]|uniref:ADP/ATP translocase 3-like n=1 Tax=Anneissia japonica TaxID=1529436 RepID=UPI0014258848|nr:ADP/ATP translocase 3-like [Anneissia japonica]
MQCPDHHVSSVHHHCATMTGVPSFFKNLTIGGLSAIIAKVAVAPLERVQLLLQVQPTLEIPPNKRYKGLIDCMIRIPKEQGFFSLWRGNTANVIRSFPAQALGFAFKDKYKLIFLDGVNYSKNFYRYLCGNLAAGGAAGGTAMCFVYPLDFARTRLGADLGKTATEREFSGIFDCARKIFRTDGVIGFYRGFSVAIHGFVIYRAAYFGIYDTLKESLPASRRSSVVLSLAIAEVAMIFSQISYPFDTVRRRMMMQSGRPESEMLYKSAMHCWRKIYREEGVKAFFRGIVSNFLKSTGSALVLVMYDQLHRLI